MVRSLSFIHLFVILAIGYIGGALLFREMPATAIEKLIAFYDARVVLGHEAGYIKTCGNDGSIFRRCISYWRCLGKHGLPYYFSVQ